MYQGWVPGSMWRINDILTILGISKILFEQKKINCFIFLLIYHEETSN